MVSSLGGDAGLEHDKGLHLLHLQRVRHADDAAHLHQLVGVEDVLQLGGIDIVAAGDDHALDALLEVDKAVLVHGAQIPGVDPGQAVGVALEGLRRLLRVVEVAQHHRGAATGRSRPSCAVGHLLLRAGLDDLIVGIREGNADGALPGHVVRASGRRR